MSKKIISFKCNSITMSLTPQALLNHTARLNCIERLKELPNFTNKNPSGKTRASVLVPLCVVNAEVCLLYTLRSSKLNSHSGQVSFPGGKRDPNENAIETALRETEEEIGIARENIDVWSEMSDVQGRDGKTFITPVVGHIRNFSSLTLSLNIDEVEEVFTVPMKMLCDKENHAHFKFEGVILPVYVCGGHKIWGITGFITHSFLQSFLPSNIYEVDFQRNKYELDELLPSKL